jgi:regulator of replication initiation timing
LEANLSEVRAESEAFEKHLADAQATSQAQAVELAQLRERLALTEQTAKSAGEQHAVELEKIRTELCAFKQTTPKSHRIFFNAIAGVALNRFKQRTMGAPDFLSLIRIHFRYSGHVGI